MHRPGSFKLMLLQAVCSLVLTGCLSPPGETLQEQRASVLQMRRETLAAMNEAHWGFDRHARQAAGYGVFCNYGLKVFLTGSASGYGVVHCNRTGEDTFMRMLDVSLGLGVNARDGRMLLIFNDDQVMREFISDGWDFYGSAEAGAMLHREGRESNALANHQDIEVYQITESGLVLQAVVAGTKFWQDDELNLDSSPLDRPVHVGAVR